MNLAVLNPDRAWTSSPDLLTLLRQYQLIPQLLQCMVIDRAIASVAVTDDERQLELVRFYERHQLNSPIAIEAWLDLNHLTTNEIESVALRSLRIEKFKLKTWGNKLESHFLKRKSSLDRVVYSLIRTQDLGLAKEIYHRLQDDRQSFEELAHQFSEGAEHQTGGRIGPVPLSQPHPIIGQLLTVSQAGQLWPPRQIDEWFAIVRLEYLEPIRFDDEVKHYLLQELFETWVRAEVTRQSPAMLQALSADLTRSL